MNEKLLVLPVLIPLISGIITGFVPSRSKKARNIFVFLSVFLNSLMILALLIAPPADTLILLRFTDAYSISLKADGAGSVFLALIAFLWLPTTLYSFEYMEHEDHLPRFYGFYLMCYGATAGAALSANLLTTYLFYLLLTGVTFPLIAHKRDQVSSAAAKKYLVYSFAGAIIALAGMIMLFSRIGCSEYVYGGTAGASAEGFFLPAAYLMTFIGFGVSAAVFPLHAWLPAACVAPAPADALLDSVALMNAGVFACIRCTFYAFGIAALAGTLAQKVTTAIAILTILFGSVMALREQHLERRLTYSTISNMSYILFGTSLMTSSGLTAGFSHMVFHGVIKLTLFSCAGTVLHKTGREFAPETTGLGRRMPLTFLTFFLAALALTGTPPLPGFISKMNLLLAASEADSPWATAGIVALLLSALLTAAYLLPLCVRAFLVSKEDEPAFTENDSDPGPLMLISFALLSLVILLLCVFAAPVMALLESTVCGY